MSDETPNLRIVPAPDLPAITEGTERVVAELTEMFTTQMASAYMMGFRQAIAEYTAMLRDAGHLTPEIAEKVTLLTEQWADNQEVKPA